MAAATDPAAIRAEEADIPVDWFGVRRTDPGSVAGPIAEAVAIRLGEEGSCVPCRGWPIHFRTPARSADHALEFTDAFAQPD
jgi:hypothetical protein